MALTACKNSVSLAFLKWIKNEIIYRISELMLPTLITSNRNDKNHFIFNPVQDRLIKILQNVRGHIL